MDSERPLPFDPDNLVTVDLLAEFYFDGGGSVQQMVEVQVTPDLLGHPQGKDALMEMATNYIMGKLNSRNELWAILTNSQAARTIVVLDKLAGITLYPPGKEQGFTQTGEVE